MKQITLTDAQVETLLSQLEWERESTVDVIEHGDPEEDEIRAYVEEIDAIIALLK